MDAKHCPCGGFGIVTHTNGVIRRRVCVKCRTVWKTQEVRQELIDSAFEVFKWLIESGLLQGGGDTEDGEVGD